MLHSLYVRVPAIACRGLCWASCGVIDMSPTERRQLAAEGYQFPTLREVASQEDQDTPFYCPALTADRRCAVYDNRPMICRLWGTSVDMPCPHGCRPDRYLGRAESMALLLGALTVGGAQEANAARDIHTLIGSAESLEGQAVYDSVVRRGMRSDRRRAMYGE
jgi:hypothetical protein